MSNSHHDSVMSNAHQKTVVVQTDATEEEQRAEDTQISSKLGSKEPYHQVLDEFCYKILSELSTSSCQLYLRAVFQVDLRKVKANSNPLNCGRAPTLDGVERIKASITKGFPVDCKDFTPGVDQSQVAYIMEEAVMMAILHGTVPQLPEYSTQVELNKLDPAKFLCTEGGHRKVACEDLNLQTWPTKVISGYSLKNKQKLMTRSQLLTLLKDPNIQKTFAQKGVDWIEVLVDCVAKHAAYSTLTGTRATYKYETIFEEQPFFSRENRTVSKQKEEAKNYMTMASIFVGKPKSTGILYDYQRLYLAATHGSALQISELKNIQLNNPQQKFVKAHSEKNSTELKELDDETLYLLLMDRFSYHKETIYAPWWIAKIKVVRQRSELLVILRASELENKDDLIKKVKSGDYDSSLSSQGVKSLFMAFLNLSKDETKLEMKKGAPKKDSKQEKSAQNESKSKPQESVTEVQKTAVPKTIVPKKLTIKKKYKTSGSSAFLKPVYELTKGEEYNEERCTNLANVTLIVNQNAKEKLVFDNKPTQIILDDLCCQSDTDALSYVKTLQDLSLLRYFGDSTIGFLICFVTKTAESVAAIMRLGFHVHDITSWETDANLCDFGLTLIYNSVEKYSTASIILFSMKADLPSCFSRYYRNNGIEKVSSALPMESIILDFSFDKSGNRFSAALFQGFAYFAPMKLGDVKEYRNEFRKSLRQFTATSLDEHWKLMKKVVQKPESLFDDFTLSIGENKKMNELFSEERENNERREMKAEKDKKEKSNEKEMQDIKDNNDREQNSDKKESLNSSSGLINKKKVADLRSQESDEEGEIEEIEEEEEQEGLESDFFKEVEIARKTFQVEKKTQRKNDKKIKERKKGRNDKKIKERKKDRNGREQFSDKVDLKRSLDEGAIQEEEKQQGAKRAKHVEVDEHQLIQYADGDPEMENNNFNIMNDGNTPIQRNS